MLSINPINQPQASDSFYDKTLNKLKNIDANSQKKKLKEAAKAFESILLYQMFKSMNENVIKSNLIKENQGEKIFKDFLLKERSEKIARNTNLGIAEMIYNQFSKYVK